MLHGGFMRVHHIIKVLNKYRKNTNGPMSLLINWDIGVGQFCAPNVKNNVIWKHKGWRIVKILLNNEGEMYFTLEIV